MTEKNSPLKRLKKESQQAFEAFVTYAEMGVNRSIDKAYLKAVGAQSTSKRGSHSWFKWSKEFEWVERAREYDNWCFDQRQQEKIRLRKFIIEEIGDRLVEDLKKDLSLSQELSNHLERFLRNDMNPLVFKNFCAAHKDIVTTRKEIYQTYMGLTGINFLADRIAEEERKNSE